jgi:hypothetical protein
MNTDKLRFVHKYVDRHGHPRHYFRRKGLPHVALPGGYGSPEFMETYWRYVKEPDTIPPPRMSARARRKAAPLPAPKGEFVYFLRVGDRIKIGRSTNPGNRVSALRSSVPARIESFIVVRGSPADEKRLHVFLRRFRTNGEWFKASQVVISTMLRCARFSKVVLDGRSPLPKAAPAAPPPRPGQAIGET